MLGPLGGAGIGSHEAGLASRRVLLSSLSSGAFPIVSIVVPIDTLVISGQRTPLPGQLRRIRRVDEFRRDVEAAVGVPVSPAEPARFLQALAGGVLSEAQALRESVTDDAARADLDAYVGLLADRTRAVTERLDEDDGTFELVLGTMDYEYSRQTAAIRRIRTDHDDAIDDDAAAHIERVLELLRYFVAARE